MFNITVDTRLIENSSEPPRCITVYFLYFLSSIAADEPERTGYPFGSPTPNLFFVLKWATIWENVSG